MPHRLSALCALLLVPLAASCGSGDNPAAPVGPHLTETTGRTVQPGPADLCAAIGTDPLQRLVPAGEPEAERRDFGGFSEASCSVDTPVGAPGDSRRLWVELKRYGLKYAGESADATCRRAIRGEKDRGDWRHRSAKDLQLHLGDVTEAQVRAVRYDAEAEILLCRSGDYVRVLYEADGIDKNAAATSAQQIARRVLEIAPR